MGTDPSSARSQTIDATPRILVAEDDEQMRTLILQALTRDGYTVYEARDGAAFFAKMTARCLSPDLAFDLVISDVRMPVYDGLHMLRTMREADWSLPVILMSAFGDDATRREAHALGALFFDKPFPLEDLRAAVRSLVPI